MHHAPCPQGRRAGARGKCPTRDARILLVWAVVIIVGVILVRVILKRKHGRDMERLAKKQGLFQKKNVEEKVTEETHNQ